MITEQYVTFQTAQLLKEAGFNVPVRTQYSHRGNVWCSEKPNDYNSDKTSPTLSRPTQQLAARWLRETHNILLILNPVLQGWIYDLYDLKKHQYILCNEDAFTENYEEAYEAALQEALRLIIKP